MRSHRQPFWRSRQAVPVVFVHGTGADGGEMRNYLEPYLAALDWPDCYLFFPSFETPYHFLLPRADGELIDLLEEAQAAGECNGRCVLVGFSGGAQFVHRFALKHPQRVASAVCLSAGCWTNPHGESYGMMVDDSWFTRPPWNTREIAATLLTKADPHYQTISWIVGCGSGDHPSRVRSARRFYTDLGAVQKCYFPYAAAHELPTSAALRFFSLLTAEIQAAATTQTTFSQEGKSP